MMKNRILCSICLIILAISLFAEVDVDLEGDAVINYQWDSREVYPNNEFSLKRIRPSIEAEIDSVFECEISFELRNGTAELKDANIEWAYRRWLNVGCGITRKQFGMEDIRSFWNTPSVNFTKSRDIIDDAGFLNRDLGVWVEGKSFQEPYQLEYELGVFNGHYGTARTSEKQYAARLTYSPLEIADIVMSYSTGMDTLGLKWRSAYTVGIAVKPENFGFFAEYLTGNDIFTDEKFECYYVSSQYTKGRFTPYAMFENNKYDDDKEKQMTHAGLRIALSESIAIKAQGSYIDEKNDDAYTELTLQIHVRLK